MDTITINKSEHQEKNLKDTMLFVNSEPKTELVFPTKNLGLIKEFNREDLYDEYISENYQM